MTRKDFKEWAIDSAKGVLGFGLIGAVMVACAGEPRASDRANAEEVSWHVYRFVDTTYNNVCYAHRTASAGGIHCEPIREVR